MGLQVVPVQRSCHALHLPYLARTPPADRHPGGNRNSEGGQGVASRATSCSNLQLKHAHVKFCANTLHYSLPRPGAPRGAWWRKPRRCRGWPPSAAPRPATRGSPHQPPCRCGVEGRGRDKSGSCRKTSSGAAPSLHCASFVILLKTTGSHAINRRNADASVVFTLQSCSSPLPTCGVRTRPRGARSRWSWWRSGRGGGGELWEVGAQHAARSVQNQCRGQLSGRTLNLTHSPPTCPPRGKQPPHPWRPQRQSQGWWSPAPPAAPCSHGAPHSRWWPRPVVDSGVGREGNERLNAVISRVQGKRSGRLLICVLQAQA